jgi:oxygen-independent coproporphyrinogen-3 oxidase
MKPQKIFETGLLYHHYANTAYPLTPGSFREYRINDSSLIGDFLKKEWSQTDTLSLYVHIPFCTARCNFCEYTVLPECTATTETEYVDLLLREIEMYRPLLQGKRIEGFDVGGGTPTKISIENLRKVTDAVTKGFSFQDNVVFSIETTPAIAAQEPEKLKEVFNLGYTRISMGVQTVSEKLLNELGREGSTHIYEQAVRNIRAAGYERFNIDLMYGFLHQTDADFESTLRYSISLEPEYITLYRNRYKGTKLEDEAAGVSLYKIINQYRLAYRVLTENGYKANPGKNTFSKVQGDHGTSDYLTKRVIEGTPYLGMGLGAQSFGVDYLAYNDGAASKTLDRYREKIEEGEFPIQDIYRLPQQESVAKVVSVAFYFGFIDRGAFSQRFGGDFETMFSDEIAYLLEQGLMEWQGARLYLTSRGADYINGVIPLFYSDRSKDELIALANRGKECSSGEKEFLSAYAIDTYERPSVTADMIILKRRKDVSTRERSSSVLLIRRGEHPYMGMWALPGGFARPGESVDQTALRELQEEAGLTGVTLEQKGVFSKPGRDPRGWIISCAFVGEVSDDHEDLVFGDDAVDARWFEMSLDNAGQLATLAQGDIIMGLDDLAFDHSEILQSVLTIADSKETLC